LSGVSTNNVVLVVGVLLVLGIKAIPTTLVVLIDVETLGNIDDVVVSCSNSDSLESPERDVSFAEASPIRFIPTVLGASSVLEQEVLRRRNKENAKRNRDEILR
jgi:hypothetical protein